jgi:hypothetical protein
LGSQVLLACGIVGVFAGAALTNVMAGEDGVDTISDT